MNQIAEIQSSSLIPQDLQEKVFVGGDLSKLNPNERLVFYSKLCESLNLNPMTRPFEYITLQGKMTLYARKDATEQLRKTNKISIENMNCKKIDDIYIVQVDGIDSHGRRDTATGAVNVTGLKGDALANAYMKAETKAKRRFTLSICGLGLLDESELETIPEINNREKNNKNNELFKNYINLINDSKSIEQLKHIFTEGYNQITDFYDREEFIRAKDDKKKEIEENIRKASLEIFGGVDRISGEKE